MSERTQRMRGTWSHYTVSCNQREPSHVLADRSNHRTGTDERRPACHWQARRDLPGCLLGIARRRLDRRLFSTFLTFSTSVIHGDTGSSSSSINDSHWSFFTFFPSPASALD